MNYSSANIQQVKKFWESSPLFDGESSANIGSKEYFIEHSRVYLSDCFAGRLDQHLFPASIKNGYVLDLGCGPGFWVEQLSKCAPEKICAADLTDAALELTQKRANFLGINNLELFRQNAESLSFASNLFDHVNCQGVIHHTPDTESAAREICRVCKPGGTVLISVYYKNVLLRLWPLFRPFVKVLARFGGGMKGRGRESIFSETSADEIVRLYDGDQNPIGKCYSASELVGMLGEGMVVKRVFYHFFPARSLPFPLHSKLHRFLDKHLPFMVYVLAEKKLE